MMAKKIRKRYQRPLVKQVKLAPEEAVLTACKTAATADMYAEGKPCGHVSVKCPDAGT